MNVISPEICEAIARTVFHSLWQLTAIAAVAFAIVAAMNNQTSRLRYSVLIASQAAMILCVGTTFLYLSSSRQPAHIAHTSAATPQFHPQTHHEVTDLPAAVPDASAPTQPANDYGRYVAAAYLIGVAIMFIRLCAGVVGGTHLIRCSEPITESRVLVCIAKAVRAAGMQYTPAIAYCTSVAVPAVVGVIRPTLLLPFSVASGMNSESLELLIMHELAHIQRHDHLINLAQRALEAILFYHPAVWFISYRVRDERELCCDDVVLSKGRKSENYVEALVQMADIAVAEPFSRAALVQLAATGRRGSLRHRVTRLIGESEKRSLRLKRSSTVTLAIVFACAICFPLYVQSSVSHSSPGDAASVLERELDAHPGSANDFILPDWPRLHRAAAYGTADDVSLLLARGADANLRQKEGWTALHYAVALNRLEILNLLLEHGADANAKNGSGATPLHAALHTGSPVRSDFNSVDESVVQTLLKHGAKADLGTNSGFTPLHAAAQTHRKKIVEMFLTAGVHVNIGDKSHRTALFFASQSGDREIIELLLSHGADPNIVDVNGWNMLDSMGIQTRKWTQRSLRDFRDAAAPLLNAGLKPSFAAAITLGLSDIVEKEVASDPQVVNRLPEKTVARYYALHFASDCGDDAMCKLLLAHGADVHLKAGDGRTALDLAAMRSEPDHEVTATLLAAGSDPNSRDKFGFSSIAGAALDSDAETLNMLFNSGGIANAAGEKGHTALHTITEAESQKSSQGRRFENAKILIQHGADPNAKNSDGDTPLHFAAEGRLAEFAQLYLNAGADPNLTNARGETPLAIASVSGSNSETLIKLLLQHGAKESVSSQIANSAPTTPASQH